MAVSTLASCVTESKKFLFINKPPDLARHSQLVNLYLANKMKLALY